LNSRIDHETIRESGDWKVFEVTPSMRRSRLEFAPGQFIIRTEYLAEDDLIEENRTLLNDSATKRFGEGRVIARVPLNKLYADFAGRWNDPEFDRWWANRDENRPFRTFRGKV
jgi:hypothetical protein